MNFTPLLASIKQEIGQFNPNEVTSMRFDMRPQGESFGMYATVVLTNGKQYEGWTDAPAAPKADPKAKASNPKALKQIEDANDTGVPLSELQPEGVVHGQPVGSKDGDHFPEGTPAPHETITPVPNVSVTTETPYPTGQVPTNKK